MTLLASAEGRYDHNWSCYLHLLRACLIRLYAHSGSARSALCDFAELPGRKLDKSLFSNSGSNSNKATPQTDELYWRPVSGPKSLTQVQRLAGRLP